jgi:outer membrane protein assembly factor BamB/tetratricopeptide (TPR) repeat protein
MSATQRFRVGLGLLGFAIVALAAPTVVGKPPADTVAKDGKEEPRTDSFTPPLDETRAPKIIESVIKHLKPDLPTDEWKDIITNLQALLDDPTDKLVEWVDPLSKDRKPKQTSIKIVVNVLIGRFSKQGRDFYQREVGAAADQKLKDAVERGDAALLNEVSLRYFHTKAGAEATVLIGRRHLDRGHYSFAAETFRRYMQRNHDDPVPVHVNFMAALSYRRLAIEAAARNSKDEKEIFEKHAAEFWDKVRKEVGGKEVAFGPKKVTLAQLEAAYNAPVAIRAQGNERDWPMARGNLKNNGQGYGSRPFLDPTWQFSMTPILTKLDEETRGSAMSWIEQNLKQFMQMYDRHPNNPPIPAFFPVAAAGRIVFRTYDGIYCVATRDDPNQVPPVKSGEMLWMVECEHSLFSMVKEGGPRSQIEQTWKPPYLNTGPYGIFFENGLIGSLSHDGAQVYFVDDMAMPPHPQMQMQFNGFQGGGQAMTFIQPLQDMVHHNKLHALNLETGKLVWKVGGRATNKKTPVPGEAEKETAQSLLADAFFLGAPLPHAGKLYVVIEKDREMRLVCLDPSKIDPETHHPELVWSQPLGMPNVPLPTDTLRRIQGVFLAYSDQTLVVPTNAGAVLGIDLMSHSIVWARSYRLSQNNGAVDPNAGQPGINFRRGGNGMVAPNPNQLLNADRWRTSTPIIAAGKVIFTAYDANSIMCLGLRDGETIWEATRSSDDLYVAGVYDNKVLVVGKGSVKFLDLNKGTLLGTLNTGTPSGVGTASDDVYFLPLRPSRDNPDPEIVSIDVKKMTLTARTRSRKKVPAGNLVFFDNSVFSQSPYNLTSFPQLSIKKEEATRRLAANPNDPVGLAEVGDLELDDGKLNNAIDAYNRCLANNPNVPTKAKAREKLYDAITELLQRDFNAGEKMLDQYRDLCTVEVADSEDALAKQRKVDEELRRKSNYFCLVAKGREGQGRLLEAFDNYLAFGAITGNKELVAVIDQPNTQARPDLWSRGRISHMIEKATPAQRKPLLEKARQQWEAMKAGGDLEKLRNFVRIFGTGFDTGNEARLLLAEKLMAANGEDDLREAENILLGLKGFDDPSVAARATEALARLYIRKGLLDDAIGLYSELNRNFPKSVVSDGRTGSDVFNDLITDKRFLPYIEPLRENWLHARFKAQETTAYGNVQSHQTFTIAPEGESIPFFNRYKIVMDMMAPGGQQGTEYWVLKVIDRLTGEERFRSQQLKAPQYIWTYPTSNNHRFAQIRGHLMILNLNNKVFAFDLADRKKLWEYDLFGKTPMPMPIPVRVENEADGVRLYYQDGWTQKVGQVGVVESNYVCLITRDGLVAVDPARGNVLWTKSNVSARVQLMGDENHIFVFESNAEGAVTSARAIRAADGVEVQIQDSAQVFSNLKKAKTAGRRVLVLDEKNGKKSMRLYDILTAKDDWKRDIDGGATMLHCEDPNLAGFVSDKGEVVIFSVKDGKEIFTGRLDAKMAGQHLDKLESAVLLADRERFYVFLNKPGENNLNYNPSVNPGIRTMRVNGGVYCFDRATQKRLWRTDEQFENQQIVLDQFQDLPIILGAHAYNRINNGVFENSLRLIAIDKRTGLSLYRKEVQQGAPFHALTADPRTGTVEFARMDMKIKFVPDDSKVVPAGTKP